MRADRLLSILLMLQVNTRLTARELAGRLEVSERTILRDMEALSTAGVPVTAERGAGGGWHLLQEYRTDLTGLNAAEAQTLFLARSSRLLADLGRGQIAEVALIKLIASLPARARQDVEHTRERLHVDGAGWYKSDEVPWLPLIQDAVWRERRVQMDYQRADGMLVSRLVDALGLVAKGSVWYLVGAGEGEMRSYRVSRVQQAQVTEQQCVRPEGFSLAAFWEQSVTEVKTSIPRYPVRVRVGPVLLTRLRQSQSPLIEREEERDENGWMILTVMFETESEACGFILQLGSCIEVLDPPALRARVRLVAENIVALYSSLGFLATVDDLVSTRHSQAEN